jgi:beta-galactosidase
MRIVSEMNWPWLFSKTCSVVPEKLPKGEGWERVELPHTWNAVDGHDGSQFDRGAYWYVTEFYTPHQPLPGGRVFVEVGAASLRCEVWVNGKMIGTHSGGYSAFRFDITDACIDTGKNTMALLCDNTYSEKIYPQRADFTFYGGLYRGVRLISVAQSHFTLDMLGGSGVFIDATPCDGGAKVEVRAHLDGLDEKQTVGLQIIDADSKVVAEAWSFAKEETKFKIYLTDARLWQGVEDPYLYTAKLQLVSYNEVLDEVSTQFGIRSFSVDKEVGFILNGEPYALRGVCRHQDRLYKGNALSREEHFEDAQIISDMGANCIRLAHYQQSHDIYEACDQLGLVVWAEIPYFTTNWDDDAHATAVNEIKEMCVQNYNHPSICFWGLSNEVLMGGNDNPKLLKCHQDLADAVRSIDTTRLTVIAHEYGTPWDHKLHDISDVEGWNHYFGWYRGPMSDLEEWLDEYHSKYPERCVSVSEYGCDGILTYHSENPAKMDYTEEYQALIHEHACEVFATRPWIWGTFVWNMFDFGSSFRREGGTRGRNNKGLVTMDRKIKKDAYYVYKAWFSKDPFVHIAGKRFFARPGKEIDVRVYSNYSEVSLYVDGQLHQTVKGSQVFVFTNVPLSSNGSFLTAKAGDCTDSVTLYSVQEKPSEYTFPEFRYAQDARNWFNSIEEVSAGLEAEEGYYSVHDRLSEVAKSSEAKRVVLDCMIVVLERSFPEERLFASTSDITLTDLLSSGIFKSVSDEKRALLLKRMNAALHKVKKPE